MRRRALTALAAALVCAGCGEAARPEGGPGAAGAGTPAARAAAAAATSSTAASLTASAPAAHPQAVEPVAGAAPAASGGRPGAGVGGSAGVSGGAADGAGVSVGPPAGQSSLARPQSDSAILRELARSGMTADPNQATLSPAGLAVAPVNAPAAVQEVIAAGNQIARLPYRYAGGHMTYEDTAYDCSGSLSFVLSAARLLSQTVDSTELESWGAPGPGKWITVFANAGHTFMYVAGLRFDTVALAQTGTRWSDRSADEPDLHTFVERHPPGL